MYVIEVVDPEDPIAPVYSYQASHTPRVGETLCHLGDSVRMVEHVEWVISKRNRVSGLIVQAAVIDQEH